jgi:hypothetical protein
LGLLAIPKSDGFGTERSFIYGSKIIVRRKSTFFKKEKEERKKGF